MKRFCPFLFLLLAFALGAGAQNDGYAGRDFWFTSSTNLHEIQDSTLVYVTGDTACTGYVENPNTSYYETFSVVPGHVTILKIPKTETQCPLVLLAYHNGVTYNLGIHLSSSRNIYAYLQTHCADSIYSREPTNPQEKEIHTFKCPLIPVHYLEDHLSFRPYCLTLGGSDLYVVAVEDSTELHFHCDIQQPYHDLNIHLNRGQVFAIRSQSTLFSRQVIIDLQTNCKKIACYSGFHSYNTRSFYPLYNKHLVDGKDFIVRKSCNDFFSKSISFHQFVNDPATNLEVDSCFCNRLNPEPDYRDPHTFKKVYCNRNTLPHLVEVPYVFFRVTDTVPYYFIRNPQFLMSYLSYRPNYYGSGDFQTMEYIDPRYILSKNTLPNLLPNDIMVKEWVIPTTRRNVRIVNFNLDTTFADLQIYVHENGIHTTTLNGQLLPASAFDSVPFTHRDYWVAQFGYYNDSIPEIIRVENPNGFSAYLDEFGYTAADPSNRIQLCYYHDNNSGVNFNTAPVEHSNLSPYIVDTVYRCLGDTLHLDVEYNPDSLEFDWIVDGVTHYNTRTLDIPITDLRTITAQLVIHYPCPDTTTTFVHVVLPPVIPFSTDTILCGGATLSVESPNALLYSWSTGETTPAITIDSAGIYSVTAANRGCTIRLDSFQVDLYEPSRVDFGQDTILCELASLLLDATQTHPATYEWQDHSTNTTYTVLFDGEYWVVVTDHCLGASDTIAVDYLHDFEVDLGADTTLCEGDELVLSANLPFCRYIWQDGSTGPRFVVRQPGNYSVTATNLCYSHSDDIDIAYEPCAQELWMPNAFTPDDDGLNDRFVPVFSRPDEVEQFEMMVYDRWGSMVFLTRDLHAGWDGGDKPEGMYVWVIRYKTALEGMRVAKGSVVLGRR